MFVEHLGDGAKHAGSQIETENQQRKLRFNVRSRSEPDQRVLKADGRGIASVHGRPANKFFALPFELEKDVSCLELVDLLLFRGEVHAEHVSCVEPVLEDVRDPQIRDDVRPLLVLGRPLATQPHLASVTDFDPIPRRGDLDPSQNRDRGVGPLTAGRGLGFTPAAPRGRRVGLLPRPR